MFIWTEIAPEQGRMVITVRKVSDEKYVHIQRNYTV